MKKSINNLVALLCCLVTSGIYAHTGFRASEVKSLIKKDLSYVMRSDSLIKNSGGADRKQNINEYFTKSLLPDWTKAPNSYIFDPVQNSDGLYIPVRKAYAMWEQDKYIGGRAIPNGKITADVLWEDVHGLIKSGPSYSLEVVDSGQSAKIRVPVNKAKKGNAVIAFRVDGEIYWSWHVWVTDDPSNGSKYKSYPNVKRQRADGITETIPDSDWGWMDRNLGAVGSSITADEWNKNGGLLYQWGRKDPIPPLVYKGNDFYEVTGSIGRIRHRGAKTLPEQPVLIISENLFCFQTRILPIISDLRYKIR
ncbi:hypothetical protein [Chryseobacterium wanjuense]